MARQGLAERHKKRQLRREQRAVKQKPPEPEKTPRQIRIEGKRERAKLIEAERAKQNLPVETKPERISRKQREAAYIKLAESLGTPLFTSKGVPASLQGMLSGGPAFLVMGGPSLKQHDLSKLKQRGVFTLAINNVACVVKPNAFIMGDPAQKFHLSIWKDPSIMKFVPRAKLHNNIRKRWPDGHFTFRAEKVCECPNVWGFNRNAHFKPGEWLNESSINWGNDKRAAKENKLPQDLATMFSAIKLLYHLGARKVFLLGCDFLMQHGKDVYCFKEDGRDGKVNSNNESFTKQAYLYRLLLPHFKKKGFEVYNCNKQSHLDVFPYLDYDEAVGLCTEDIDQEPIADGYYKKM